MIIIVKGADFSANKLEQIEVSTQLSEYTKAAINAGGREDLTTTQKVAINKFFNVMGAGNSGNTIISRMRYIFIPILASSLDKSLINYATNAFEKVLTPNSAQWTLNSTGIAGVDETSTGSLSVVTSEIFMQNNISMLAMHGTLMPANVSGNQHYIAVRGKTTTSKWVSYYEYNRSQSIGTYNLGSLPDQWVGGGVADEGIPAISGYNLQSSSDGQYVKNSKILDLASFPNVDMSDQTQQTLYICGLSSKNIIPTAFAMIGESMTDAEFADVVNALKGLRSAFLL